LSMIGQGGAATTTTALREIEKSAGTSSLTLLLEAVEIWYDCDFLISVLDFESVARTLHKLSALDIKVVVSTIHSSFNDCV